jgi:hypothetical protein
MQFTIKSQKKTNKRDEKKREAFMVIQESDHNPHN